MSRKPNGFKSGGPGKIRGAVLEHSRIPYIGARVKRWAPGHGDNGMQGVIIGFRMLGEPDPKHEAWRVDIMWPGKVKTTEYVTY
jgi:hypothetical protein